MSTTKYTLLDAQESIGPEVGNWHSPDPSGWSVKAALIPCGPGQGVYTVELNSGTLSLTVLPTRGMGIWKGSCGDIPLGWKSPVPLPVHPSLVDLGRRGGLGWLDGFNELMCRCGLTFNGPPGNDEGTDVTLHGRIANLPAHRVELTVPEGNAGALVLEGWVYETTMFGPCWELMSRLELPLGQTEAYLKDVVTNIGGQPQELSLLYHINLGAPFLGAGSRNAIGFRDLVPRDARAAEGVASHDVYLAPTPGFTEEGFYYRPAAVADGPEAGWSTGLIRNAAGDLAFATHFNSTQLPCFTVWKNTQSVAEGYVTGLEPGINFPNFRAYERAQQRLPIVQPGQSYLAEQRWEVARTAEHTARLERLVADQQALFGATVYDQPQSGWSPAGEQIPPPVVE
jgi:hypothetical protein